MNFKEITIDDREEINGYFEKYGGKTAENSFTNMFIWGGPCGSRFAVSDGFLVMKSDYEDVQKICGFPIGNGDLKSLIYKLHDYFVEKFGKFELINVPDESRKIIEKIMPGHFEFEHTRNEDDYIYEVSKLISLSGKKLHSKRNNFNYFNANYKYVYEKINKENLEECRAYLLNHIKENTADKVKEPESINVLFDNYERLCVKGGLLRTDGKIIAVSVGEKYNGGAIIHVEKAERSIRGAYTTINKLLLENEFSDCVYVNREEDMGIEGMRQAKMSYNPVFLLEKFRGRWVHD